MMKFRRIGYSVHTSTMRINTSRKKIFHGSSPNYKSCPTKDLRTAPDPPSAGFAVLPDWKNFQTETCNRR